jgi:hypothetical protein
MLQAWQNMINHHPGYLGHSFMRHPKITKVTHIRPKFVTAAISAKSNLHASTIARVILNHVPTGEFRTRFFPHLSTTCNWCPGVLQTRSHVLYDCSHYNHFWNYSKDPDLIADPAGFDKLVECLKRNRTAFTFQDSPEDPDDTIRRISRSIYDELTDIQFTRDVASRAANFDDPSGPDAELDARYGPGATPEPNIEVEEWTDDDTPLINIPIPPRANAYNLRSIPRVRYRY